MFRTLVKRSQFPLSDPALRAHIKDPWAKHHAWKKDPRVSKIKLREVFPGFGTAVAIFSVYCLYDHFFNKHDDSHGHH